MRSTSRLSPSPQTRFLGLFGFSLLAVLLAWVTADKANASAAWITVGVIAGVVAVPTFLRVARAAAMEAQKPNLARARWTPVVIAVAAAIGWSLSDSSSVATYLALAAGAGVMLGMAIGALVWPVRQ